MKVFKYTNNANDIFGVLDTLENVAGVCVGDTITVYDIDEIKNDIDEDEYNDLIDVINDEGFVGFVKNNNRSIEDSKYMQVYDFEITQ